MRIVIPIVGGIVLSLILTGTILVSVNKSISNHFSTRNTEELQCLAWSVQNQFEDISNQIVVQLHGLCSTIADDRDFAMKLIVEKDYSASEVTEIASNYMKVMGFSLLQITDSDFRILSSGHFPASSGNVAQNKQPLPDSVVLCVLEDIKGKKTLSLQSKLPFICAGVTLYAIGGIRVDDALIARLNPGNCVKVIFRYSHEIVGMDSVVTMSDIKENKIIINDKTWYATSLSLISLGEEGHPEIITLMQAPTRFTLLDLL